MQSVLHCHTLPLEAHTRRLGDAWGVGQQRRIDCGLPHLSATRHQRRLGTKVNASLTGTSAVCSIARQSCGLCCPPSCRVVITTPFRPALCNEHLLPCCGAPCVNRRSSVLADVDLQFLSRAAELADASAGLTQPHPAAGCVLVSANGAVVAETHQRAQVTAMSLPASTRRMPSEGSKLKSLGRRGSVGG